MNEQKQCDCGKKCTKIHIMATNEIMYSCPGSKSNSTRKLRIGEVDPLNVFCKFKEFVSVGPNRVAPPIESFIYTHKPQNNKNNIKYLVRYFLEFKKHITFQEIELNCKSYGIGIFDDNKETMYEFTQRVLLEFSKL